MAKVIYEWSPHDFIKTNHFCDITSILSIIDNKAKLIMAYYSRTIMQYQLVIRAITNRNKQVRRI